MKQFYSENISYSLELFAKNEKEANWMAKWVWTKYSTNTTGNCSFPDFGIIKKAKRLQ